MSGPIPVMPVFDLRAVLLELLIKGRERKDAQMVHLAVSMTEYLKDAERWRFFMENGPVLNDVSEMTPGELLKFVNEKLEFK